MILFSISKLNTQVYLKRDCALNTLECLSKISSGIMKNLKNIIILHLWANTTNESSVNIKGAKMGKWMVITRISIVRSLSKFLECLQMAKWTKILKIDWRIVDPQDNEAKIMSWNGAGETSIPWMM